MPRPARLRRITCCTISRTTSIRLHNASKIVYTRSWYSRCCQSKPTQSTSPQSMRRAEYIIGQWTVLSASAPIIQSGSVNDTKNNVCA
jgi:hypothetical protein